MNLRSFIQLRNPANLHLAAATQISRSPSAVAQIYGLPKIQNGVQQKFGIVSLGGQWALSDFNAFASLNSIPAPVITLGNPGSSDPTFDIENAMDVEGLAGVYSYCTGLPAMIDIYQSADTAAGIANALRLAKQNNPSVLLIAYGQIENLLTSAERSPVDALLQDLATNQAVSIVSTSGDIGSAQGVTWPGCNPYCWCVGATSYTTIEAAWASTGGGISGHYPTPSYQASMDVGARQVPDAAAVGDPNTGLNIVLNGHNVVAGGTSAAAPIWAGIFGMVNAALGKRIGWPHPWLYNNRQLFNDIITGSNGVWLAKPGFDYLTGWGSPNGPAFGAMLQPSVPTFIMNGLKYKIVPA